jgi:hypothetical protein
MRDWKMILLAVISTAVGLGVMVASLVGDGSTTKHVVVARATDTQQHQFETLLTHEMPLASVGRLVVDVHDADVTVEATPTGAEVAVDVGARDAAWAREVFDRMQFDVSLDGNVLTVRSGDPHIQPGEWRERGGAGVRVRVAVPSQVDVTLNTGDGDVVIGNREGRVEVRTSDGDVGLGTVRGPAVVVSTSDGDITADRLEAGHIEVRTNDGDVTLEHVLGSVEAATSDGDVCVHLEAPAAVAVRTGDGDVCISTAGPFGLDLDLQGGDLVLPNGLAFDGTISPRAARGSINGGGPRITAVTGDGTVTIEIGQR